MGVDAIRHCLYAHGLNQLGSEDVLRKRLVQFVCRLRPSRIEGSSPEMPQSTGEHGSGAFPMTKLKQPKVLTPDTFYDYLLIIDLEATCEEGWRFNFPHEIIEFPALLFDTRRRKCVAVFHTFCRPVQRPTLSAFCRRLTNIEQSQVDAAVEFPALLNHRPWSVHQAELQEMQLFCEEIRTKTLFTGSLQVYDVVVKHVWS